MIRSIPPLHEVAGMAGVELPQYLGETTEKPDSDKAAKTEKKPPVQDKAPPPKKDT
jgi:flotillin